MPPKSSKKSKQADTAPSSSTKARTDQAPPNWPPLKPLLPPQDLSIQTILSNQIITISTLFTPTLCKSYVSFLSALPLTTTPGHPRRGEAVRVNDRFQVDDAVFARRLWTETGLEYLLTSDEGSGLSEEEREKVWGGEVLGLNPNIRIYRYVPGQFFDKHYDESNSLTLTSSEGKPVQAKTTWTLLLYLTTCEGGETVFYPEAASRRDATPEPVVVGLEVGMALLHRHGRDCLLHEGREVRSGVKWVLRSDLCVRR